MTSKLHNSFPPFFPRSSQGVLISKESGWEGNELNPREVWGSQKHVYREHILFLHQTNGGLRRKYRLRLVCSPSVAKHLLFKWWMLGQSLLQRVSGAALQEQTLRMSIPHSLEISNESCCLKSRRFRKLSAVL